MTGTDVCKQAAQLLRSAACLHTNQSRSYLNHLVLYSVGACYSLEFSMQRNTASCFRKAGFITNAKTAKKEKRMVITKQAMMHGLTSRRS